MAGNHAGSKHERFRIHRLHMSFITQGREPRLPSALSRTGRASDGERSRSTSGPKKTLTGKLIEEEQQLSAAVTIGGGTYMATTDTGATASFISKERADNLAALGKITRIRRKVSWQAEDVAESMNSWRWKSLSGTSD